MHANDLDTPTRDRDPALGAVEATLRDIRSLIGELEAGDTRRARRMVASAHIRATLTRMARSGAGSEGPRAGERARLAGA